VSETESRQLASLGVSKDLGVSKTARQAPIRRPSPSRARLGAPQRPQGPKAGRQGSGARSGPVVVQIYLWSGNGANPFQARPHPPGYISLLVTTPRRVHA